MREENCPGETVCGKFQIAALETNDGLEACRNCELLPTKYAPDESRDAIGMEVRDVVDEIGSIVFWENAGFTTDWTAYSFEYSKLYAWWRNVELEVKESHEAQTRQILKVLAMSQGVKFKK